jgi:hypothetical protein
MRVCAAAASIAGAVRLLQKVRAQNAELASVVGKQSSSTPLAFRSRASPAGMQRAAPLRAACRAPGALAVSRLRSVARTRCVQRLRFLAV